LENEKPWLCSDRREDRDLEVIANDGEYPLLGVRLLTGYDLHISYRSSNVTIE
jgi:hypothetical protein